MSERNLSPQFEESIRQSFGIPEIRSEFVHQVYGDLMHHATAMPRQSRLYLRWRLGWSVALAILSVLIIVILAVGPQRVIAAVERWLGYFPGIGFVQNTDAVRRLVEPVQLTREGYVVTVEDLEASEQQTWVKVRVEGWDRVSDDLVQPLRERDSVASLLVDDGQTLSSDRSQSYGRSPLTAEFIFPPLPDENQTVTLVLPKLPRTPKGAAPENWQFTLHLRPVGPDEGLPTTMEQDWQSPPSDGLTLFLDTIAQGTDQTVLSVRIEPENPRIRPAEDWTVRLSLQDESGRIYPLTDENLLGNQNELVQALRTRAFEGGEKLTLRLDQLLLTETQPPDSSAPNFRFDPGDQPQIGQAWRLNQTLSTERFTIHVTGAELERDPNGQVRLVFDVEGQPGLDGALFDCSAQLCMGGEGGGFNVASIKPSVLLKGLPNEPIDIRLDTVYYRAAGPWEIHWQVPTLPKEISIQPTDTPAPTPTWAPSPTADSEEPILAEVTTLFDRGLSPFLTGSGWVHVVVENQTGEDLGQDSRGGSIPSHSIMENWYELDPDGFITRMITLMKTPDGQVVQQAVTEGRYSYNFTLDTFLEFDDKPRKINFANEAMTFLQQMIANDLPLYRQETSCEGRACLLVTPFEPGEQPSRETYDRIYEAAGLPRQVWIDLETGWPVLQERFQMDAGGALQRWDSNQLLTLERTPLPPHHLLQLFEQVALPTSENQSQPTPRH